MPHVFLIGFMGSGKTSIGKRLASILNSEFIDLDEVIELKEGKVISQIFQEYGEEYFREKESNYLKSLIEKASAVIATGGGSPCFHDNMQWMNSNGITVYLKTDAIVLFDRLKNGISHRPLLSGMSEEKLMQFISSRMKERESFYRLARHTIDAANKSSLRLAREISALLP